MSNISKIVALVVAVLSVLFVMVQAQPKRIFARYRGPRGRRIIRKCGKSIIRDYDDDDIVVIETEDPTCLRLLQQDDDIFEAEEDHLVVGLGLRGGGDAGATPQIQRRLAEEIPYGIQMIQADQLDAGDNEVVVCIVDTGVALGHPEFEQANIDGTDTVKFYGPEWKWANDKQGHGTHVTGTIAAQAGNGQGVRGVSSKLKLHIVRALDDNGNGYESDIRAAVEQCVAAEAKVINLSLGGGSISSRSARYYDSFVNEYGIMMVAAAGNDGSDANVFPAAHPAVISVSAVTDSGNRWRGSNHGNQIELSAPGHQILSTMTSTATLELPNGSTYPAATIAGSLKDQVTGKIVACDAALDKCNIARNGKVCLYERQNNDQVRRLAEACQAGGGVGMIVYNSDGSSADDLRLNPSLDFVAVGIKKGHALEMINAGHVQDRVVVTVGDAGGDDQEYSYGVLTGTSMASPHVAASAGLLMTHFPRCTNHQIRYAMAVRASHPDGPQGYCDTNMGYGVVKVKDAYDWLLGNDCSQWDVSEQSQGGCTTLHLGITSVLEGV